MLESGRMTAIVGGLFFKAAVRSPAYILLTLAAAAATVLATLPVSPGIVAGEEHYLEAGAATLLLGGLLLSLVLLPGLQFTGRGRWNEEALLSLPVAPEIFALGAFAGFGAALGLSISLCGGAFIVTAEAACGTASLGSLVLAAASCFVLSMTVAAIVTAFSAFLAPLPTLIASVLLVAAGQASAFWPEAVSVLLPPFDLLDPAGMLAGGGDGVVRFLAHGAACTGFYLCLAMAVLKMRRRAASG